MEGHGSAHVAHAPNQSQGTAARGEGGAASTSSMRAAAGDQSAGAAKPSRPEVFADPYTESNYWVFIKSTPTVRGAAPKYVPSHTELALCARRKPGESADLQAIETIITGARATCSGCAGEFSQRAAQELAVYLPLCVVLMYTADKGAMAQYQQGPDDQMAYGFAFQNGVTLTWVGQVTSFDVSRFLAHMKRCGNWGEDNYNLLTNNCNMFCEATLKGMGFANNFNLLSVSEVPMVTHPGYHDVHAKSCKGMKCTRFGDPGMAGCGACLEYTTYP